MCISGIHLLFRNKFFLAVFERQLQFLHRSSHALVALNPALDAFHLAHLCLGGFGILPKLRRLRMQFFLLQLDTLLVDGEVLFQLLSTLLNVFQLLYCYHVLRD